MYFVSKAWEALLFLKRFVIRQCLDEDSSITLQKVGPKTQGHAWFHPV